MVKVQQLVRTRKDAAHPEEELLLVETADQFCRWRRRFFCHMNAAVGGSAAAPANRRPLIWREPLQPLWRGAWLWHSRPGGSAAEAERHRWTGAAAEHRAGHKQYVAWAQWHLAQERVVVGWRPAGSVSRR
eukprot:SAG31_NODE_2880_length_4958_cov_4.413460_3_plen_131_part_00